MVLPALARLASSRTRVLPSRLHKPPNSKLPQQCKSTKPPVAEHSPRAAEAESSVSEENVPPNPLLWHQRLGPVSNFITWFDRHQSTHPLRTQLFTSLAVYLAGDILAQNFDPAPYDPFRTARHLTVGAVASIPGYHWFMFLGRHFNYASRVLSISTKVVVQQIVFTPIFNTYFFGMQSLLAGAGIGGAIDRVQRTVPESMINSLKVWPAVTAVNFTFVLPQYRFMCAGVVACLWQSYLSWLNQREARRVKEEAQASDVARDGT